ncbi:hypothetical protein FA95DRAFT_1577790 [Auriscalpium vulgare]|uniref:Uncharacterized protein n=1 Tax=Auriscalpium vulgare TaxID=40419 RepID=A0ACB8R5U3_9AGAM|nr:hypothetical protein FA95DRAFT_1577790 [Auriscalpium vulgare]
MPITLPSNAPPLLVSIWPILDETQRVEALRKTHEDRFGPGAPRGEPFGLQSQARGEAEEAGGRRSIERVAGGTPPVQPASARRGRTVRPRQTSNRGENAPQRSPERSRSPRRLNSKDRDQTSRYPRSPALQPRQPLAIPVGHGLTEEELWEMHNDPAADDEEEEEEEEDCRIDPRIYSAARTAGSSITVLRGASHSAAHRAPEADTSPAFPSNESRASASRVRRTGSGSKRAKKAKQRMLRRGSQEEITREEAAAKLAEAAGPPLVDIARVKAVRDLTINQGRARMDICKATAGQFREITGVKVHEEWPEWTNRFPPRTDEVSGEVYLTPNFKAGVGDPTNKLVLKRVSDLVFRELDLDQKDKGWREDPSFKVSWDTVHELAKVTFNGFKSQFRAQHGDEETKEKAILGDHKRRKVSRRKVKARQLLSAVPAYKKIHPGLDPSPTLHADYMSDEVSGPEGYKAEYGATEAWKEWRDRMKDAMGMSAVPDEITASWKFFEVIRPNYRSVVIDELYSELRSLHAASLTSLEKGRSSHRVRTTGRTTDEVPTITPWDCMIDRTWWDDHKDDGVLYADWFEVGDPELWAPTIAGEGSGEGDWLGSGTQEVEDVAEEDED